MTAQAWLVGVGVGLLLTGSGCVTSCHQAAKASLEAGPNCEVPLCDRQHTYAVLLNGLTPTGLDGLRDQLAKHGFTKVYSADLCYVWWLEWEMRRVFREDKSARFVLVGYDLSAPSVLGMAREATRNGLAVDSVVLLDPVATQLAASSSTRTIVVRSAGDCELVPHMETVAVPEAGHFTLPTHPKTVAAVCAALNDTAARIVHPPVYSIAEKNELLPLPRPISATSPPVAPEWQFLDDQPGPHSVPLTPYPCDRPLPNLPPGGIDGTMPGQAIPLPAPRKVGEGL